MGGGAAACEARDECGPAPAPSPRPSSGIGPRRRRLAASATPDARYFGPRALLRASRPRGGRSRQAGARRSRCRAPRRYPRSRKRQRRCRAAQVDRSLLVEWTRRRRSWISGIEPSGARRRRDRCAPVRCACQRAQVGDLAAHARDGKFALQRHGARDDEALRRRAKTPRSRHRDARHEERDRSPDDPHGAALARRSPRPCHAPMRRYFSLRVASSSSVDRRTRLSSAASTWHRARGR